MESAHSNPGPEYSRPSMKKPFIDYKNIVLNDASSDLIRKRFTRYIHKIQTEQNPRNHLFKTKHVKLVYSMYIPQAYQIQANKLLKALKTRKRLINLSLGLEDSNTRKLTQFYLKTLNHIKQLHLIFNGREDAFSKYFAFPKKIQGLTLELKHFDLDNLLPEKRLRKYDFEGDPKFKSFYRQLDRLNNLQDLKLIFCLSSTAEVIGQFYESILKRMNCLKSLGYQQLHWPSYYSKTIFNLSSFWKTIASSRNSLENLDIHVPYISPFSLEDISLEMPNLKTININIEAVDQGFSADSIIKTWREHPLIKSQNVLLSLNLNGIEINSDKMLMELLDGITDIEDSPNLNLDIVVRKATDVIFRAILCRFLMRTNMQGSVSVRTNEKRLYRPDILEWIENAAVKNKTLRSFVFKEPRFRYPSEPKIDNFIEMKKGQIIKGSAESIN